MTILRIQDEEDLLVLSSLLEGGRVNVKDLAYVPQQKRFALLVTRAGQTQQTALHFDFVERAQANHLPEAGEIECLACIFEPEKAGEKLRGLITIYCVDAPRIRVFVECIDAQMRDV